MKIKKVLLRWYKSFHLNYREVFDRGQKDAYRPWNELKPEDAKESEFPFIEITIEDDITTIVGGNESGKSHLLNSINKVISGRGLDKADQFTRTDLCHYAGIRKINVEAWPNIGVQFRFETDDEIEAVCSALQQTGIASASEGSKPTSFTLILAPKGSHVGVVFIEPNPSPVFITKEQLAAIRALLPKIQFIDNEALLPSELALADLIRGYDPAFKFFGLRSRADVEAPAANVLGLNVPAAIALGGFSQTLTSIKENITSLHSATPQKDSLEILLFDQILGVKIETLKYLYQLESKDRGYYEGQIAKWNEGLNDRLNLSHFWHQDEQFNLIVDYKDGVIYYEIHDKTGCIYTFNERSSGLKYFLSYYLQALAMEMSGRNQNSIILMDEPDSALSILAQRNLLSVFESLVRPESSSQTCQLIYTTHSPYLINRNYPRRIKVVKKEDAEEGTQYIEQARARRYEPVRTALGIDSAPSLFLGSDNILLEGSTDQYILTELIRVFATPENVGDYLDLNSVVVVSADGVGNISNVLEQSRWADEPIPPTAIFLDSDEAAVKEIERVTRPEKPSTALVPREQIGLVAELVEPFGNNTAIVTTEDIIPLEIYKDAIRSYVTKWLPESLEENGRLLESSLKKTDFGSKGIVDATKTLFAQIQPELAGDFDKMGIFQEVVRDVFERQIAKDPLVETLSTNVKNVCEFLSNALSDARVSTTRYSATRSIKRLIKDFLRLNKARVPVTNVQKLFSRLEKEIAPVGADGEDFLILIRGYQTELETLRTSGQQRLSDHWGHWEDRIKQIRKNPLRKPIEKPKAKPKVSKKKAMAATPTSAEPLPKKTTAAKAATSEPEVAKPKVPPE